MRSVLAAVIMVLASSLGLAGQARTGLPPVSYVCPMPAHAHVVEDSPGRCPECQMALVPVRIDQAYACPRHAAVVTDTPGLCPLDRRTLMPVVVSRYWTCPDSAGEHLTEPGRCADGTPRRHVRESRPHGDHNPKHEGQFFMAADNWHHLEATYAEPGTLRVFLYDNFSKPITVAGITGRAAVQSTPGLATDTSPDPAMTWLTPASDGRSLVARLGRQSLPARIVLTVAFASTRPPERFDLTFEQVSRPPAGRPRKAAPATRKPAAPLPRPLGAGQAAVPPPDAADFQAAAERLPASTPELVALLRSRHQEVSDLLGRGQLGGIYLPALLAKDIALKLEEHRDELPESSRARVSDAVRRVVMTAWRIDAFGDVSDQLSVTRAFEEFSVAIGVLTAAYAAP